VTYLEGESGSGGRAGKGKGTGQRHRLAGASNVAGTCARLEDDEKWTCLAETPKARNIKNGGIGRNGGNGDVLD